MVYQGMPTHTFTAPPNTHTHTPCSKRLWQCVCVPAATPPNCLTVCASISASLSGLLPLDTACFRRRSMWMKSLALITPTTPPHALSYSGADAMPWCDKQTGGEEGREGVSSSSSSGRQVVVGGCLSALIKTNTNAPPQQVPSCRLHTDTTAPPKRNPEKPRDPPKPPAHLFVQCVEGLPHRQVHVQQHHLAALRDELIRGVAVKEIRHLLLGQVLRGRDRGSEYVHNSSAGLVEEEGAAQHNRHLAQQTAWQQARGPIAVVLLLLQSSPHRLALILYDDGRHNTAADSIS